LQLLAREAPVQVRSTTYDATYTDPAQYKDNNAQQLHDRASISTTPTGSIYPFILAQGSTSVKAPTLPLGNGQPLSLMYGRPAGGVV